jgi:uncharacterized membrane protein YhfC
MSYLSITHPLNGLLSIGLGVGLGTYLSRRFKLGWRLWWIGVITFVISQVVHIPFNYLALNPLIANLIETLPDAWDLPLIALLFGLSAAIFEEFSRYAAYRWFIKDARSWSQGLLFGAGHGGIEAIFIGGVSLYTYAQLVALRGVDLSTIVPTEQINLAQEQIALYWSMPWYDSLMGAIERAFILPLHLAGAMLVLQSFTRRQFRWVWLAVGLHTLVNAVAVYLSQSVSIYTAELTIGVTAVLEIGLILLLRRSTPVAPIEQLLVHPAPWSPIPISSLQETPDKLDETRYQ